LASDSFLSDGLWRAAMVSMIGPCDVRHGSMLLKNYFGGRAHNIDSRREVNAQHRFKNPFARIQLLPAGGSSPSFSTASVKPGYCSMSALRPVNPGQRTSWVTAAKTVRCRFRTMTPILGADKRPAAAAEIGLVRSSPGRWSSALTPNCQR